MKYLTYKLLFIFVYFLSSTPSYSIDQPNLKNLIIHKEPKNLTNIKFQNSKKDTLDLKNYKNRLIIINFWATWCAPCKEEMPSLDSLKKNQAIRGLEILPINVGRESISKSLKFFDEMNIQSLEVFNDNVGNLPNIFLLRGIPTTIFINKKGKEFARVVGTIDFQNKELIKWLKNFQ